MRPLASFVSLLIALAAAACSSDPAALPASPSTPVGNPTSLGAKSTLSVIIDTDMALDDWPAILFLLAHPRVNVVAITVSGTGEATCDAAAGKMTGAENALKLLKLAGKEDANIPVACGRSAPLAGDHAFPAAWRADADAMFGLELAPSKATPVALPAAALLAEKLAAATEPLHVLTTGPLTNVGEALEAKPELASRIAALWVMGGAMHVKGNLAVPGSVVRDNPWAEWNVYVDPKAARLAFVSGAPVKLVALDGTNAAPVTLGFRDRLGQDSTTAAARFVRDYFAKNTGFIESGEFFFWDPMAAAVMTDPSLCKWEGQRIAVVTAEGPESGRTQSDATGAPAVVCTKANGARFEKLFLDVINGRVAD